MNEATHTQLRILVERAVRPVRASFSRKRKTRTELLAHVSDVFDEELARLGDEQAALARTADRFGQPGELTKQLQAAVPTGDAIDRFFSGQPGESTLFAATRLAAWNLALAVIVFFVATSLSGLLASWPSEAILFTVSSILLLPVFMFSLTFATEWFRQAWCEPAQPRRWKVAWITLAWFTYSLALFEGVLWLSGADASNGDFTNRIWLTLWLAASIPWMPWCLAHVADARHRYYQEWASLQIE